MFILFDGRAKCGDCGDASVMDICESEAEARHAGLTTWRDYDAIWYECPNIDAKTVGPGEPRYDLPPAGDAEKFDRFRPGAAKGRAQTTPGENTERNRRKRRNKKANALKRKAAEKAKGEA